MNREFDRLCNKCPRLRLLLKEQRKNGLPKDLWLSVMCLLTDAGRIDLARKFSEQSEKHNYESSEVIDTLSIQKRDTKVYCTELGCTKEDIEAHSHAKPGCFQRRKCLTNEKGKIVNSPAFNVRLNLGEKAQIGLFDEELSKGKYKYAGMNPNIYARHILKNYNLMFDSESERFYIYRGNYWKVFKDFRLKKMLRSFFDKFEPNAWETSIQARYMSALAFECKDADDLKPAENYINIKNGLLDLDSEKVILLPHDKNVFCTTQIPIVYDSKAKCPNFEHFLSTIFKSKKQLKELVQEIMGYCLSNSVRAHKMFIFVGDGSNGKSILCEIMTALAGGIENVSNVALKDFSHKFALSQIADKTLNISTENEMDSNLDTQLLKAIASGEPIQMEEKFQSPFSYRPYVKLVFAMNNLPYVKDKSYGFERRLVIIPFDMVFVDNPKTENEAERNPDLLDELNKELAGILAFAIQGLKRLKKNNFVFTRSQTAERALEAYKEKIDPMLAYVRECIKEDEEAEPLNMTDLREHFKRWCNREGHAIMAKIAGNTFWGLLKKVLDKEGINYIKKDKGSRDLRGVTVKGLNDKKTPKTMDDLNDDFLD